MVTTDLAVCFNILQTWIISHGLRLVVILVLSIVTLKLAQTLSVRVFSSLQKRRDDIEFQKRTETLGSIVHYILTVAIVFIAAIMVLSELGVKIGPVLAAAGVVGVAVGFGAQSLVKDVLSGFFILLEDQIRVGDVVDIAGKSGLVEKINLKITILRDLAGNVHYIPNGQISIVTNMTKGYSRYVFDIEISYDQDVDEVLQVMQEVDESLRSDPAFKDDIIEPLEILGLDRFADSAVIVKARTTTKPIKQWGVAREFNRRLKKKFEEKNIEKPFPQLTLSLRQDKQGKAPSLNVRVQGEPVTSEGNEVEH
ncbi:MAG TPA: mechanosensitive ion channel family protein [Thermodesulfobacteriota bacterium]|nr:mechanosensitive ion channel family protein [Thermodesulfobacteriota bacterium]